MRETGFSDHGRLLRLAKLKLEIVTSYRELTREHRGLIEAEDTDTLDYNITQRQKLITRANDIQKEYAALLKEYNECKSPLPETDTQLSQIEKQISDMLGECKAIDAENAKAVKEHMDMTLNKAKDMSQKRTTIGAYKQGGYETSGFFDKRQ